MFTKPVAQPKFSELESEILKWWKENTILEKSIENRSGENTKTFYDGPITANGDPHIGHALTFSMKDLYPRFWTMQGYKVSRSLGWDCQGLPVEYEIEKNLGFKEKRDIEELGVEKFNQMCKELVIERRGKIVELEELIGRLTNSEEEYATMDKNYIESIWWSLKEIYSKGLLYEGFKVVPYSTRAGTTLSNAEVALGGYKSFTDPGVTVEFPLADDPSTSLLAWTTTPWTLPTNFALALGKEIEYVVVLEKTTGKKYIVASKLVEQIFSGHDYSIERNINISELIGKKYIPLFNFFEGKKNCFVIVEGFHVNTENGTGIVHLAPYGEEDNEIFKEIGIVSIDVLDDQGDFTVKIPAYHGLNYREANSKIIEDLKNIGRLFKHEDYTHDMPMCWRTNTPLIYKPITSWYIKMSSLRSQLVENNSRINWSPKHIKEGRFGNWLAEIKDWGISRSRYWGTPLPIWKSQSGKVIVIGSFEELKGYSGKEITDPHKPYVDDITFEHDGEFYSRVPDVIDVWYDSGAMPFARFHYPFENKEKFEKKFPAEYIAEGVDQTRGWFYSLLAISTALFNKEPYKNVVVNGTILADDGAKLSKSKKNYVEPEILIKEFGADTVRLNFFLSPIAGGEDATVSTKSLKIYAQEFMIPLWNIYSFFVTYANLHNFEFDEALAGNARKNSDDHPWDHIPFDDIDDELDAWILVMLQKTIKECSLYMENFEIPRAGRTIKEFLDSLSKWYIRRSRDRFAEGDIDALSTLYYVIIEILKLAAPFVPFITEYIYGELAGKHGTNIPISIHLCDYPKFDAKFLDQYSNMEAEMKVIQSICELGHSIRTQKQFKVRQPLSELLVESTNPNLPALAPWMEELISKELNVLTVVNSQNILKGDKLEVAEDLVQKIKVGLNIEITQELAEKGLLREIIRVIQAERKNRKFIQGESVIAEYFTEDEMIRAAMIKFENEIKEKTGLIDLKIMQSFDGDISEAKLGNSGIKLKLNRT